MNLRPSLLAITLAASSLLAAGGASLPAESLASNVEDEWFRAWPPASVTPSFPSQVRQGSTRFFEYVRRVGSITVTAADLCKADDALSFQYEG